MIYVDEPFYFPSRQPQAFRAGKKHGHMWSHMWCDAGDLDALHAVARKIGLLRSWFQNKPGFPHYDLVPPRRAAAIAAGAVVINLRTWLAKNPLPGVCQSQGLPCMVDIFVLAALRDACPVCAPHIPKMRSMSGWVPSGKFFRCETLAGDQVKRIDADISARATAEVAS